MGIKTPCQYRNMEFRDLLILLVQMFAPRTYVELGVKGGYTFNAVAQCSQIERAVAVDIAPMTNIITGDKIQHYQCSSREFQEKWKQKKNRGIDLLFIDADHSKEAVLDDFMRMSPYVTSYTGLICMHDTYPVKSELMVDGYCSNAWEAVRELRYDANFNDMFEFLTLPGPWAGMTIARKVHGNHGWMDEWTDRGEGV